MRHLVTIVLGLSLSAIVANHALGQGGVRPEVKQPFELIRTIDSIQDQIVLGNASARAKLPKVIAQLSDHLLAAAPEVWRDARNARAAVTYTLNGGPATVIRRVIELGLSPAPDLELMRGTVAYVEGRHGAARTILSNIKATELTPIVGGHVAMIQSALVAKDDPRKALHLLDTARVMAPGTLMEEAALCRALVIAEEIADIDRFAALSSEYIWRFPNSVYFESFRQRFASAIIQFSVSGGQTRFSKVETLIGKLESASQLRLYLQIAYKCIIEGKADVARLAAEKAVHLSPEGSIEQSRSALYEAAALILTGQPEYGAAELDNVAPRLPRQDAELKEAVAELAKGIAETSGKASGAVAPEPAGGRAPSGGPSGASASASALIEIVQQKLGQADELLERKAP